MREVVRNVVGKKREIITVTQHAGLGLAKHLLDWAGVHTGHSAEAAATIAAEVVAVEAAVVRIMKYVFTAIPLVSMNILLTFYRQRKELSHASLLTETISQLSAQFKPDVTMIKKKIESLIEREYLERIEDAALPSYRYLA